jgi:hypothetical protein
VASRTFHAPRCFHPGYSWLGRWLRRRTDRRQGEALHILIVTTLALVLLLAHYVSWTLLYEPFARSPSLAWVYWLSQLGLLGVIGATCFAGMRPALTVTCAPQSLVLEQGAHTCSVPYDAITSVQSITAQRFHRHERRYAATDVFIGALHDEVLLLRRAAGGPVVVGLSPPVHDALRDRLEQMRASRPSVQEPAAAA